MLLEESQDAIALPIVVFRVESIDGGSWHVDQKVRQYFASGIYPTIREGVPDGSALLSERFRLSRQVCLGN
jgi:hypothetical protein